jgi:HK97 family phage prohead protease
MTALTYSALETRSVDLASRTIEAVVSSETVDGHGEIIDQATWNLGRFLKNPIVLWQHDQSEPIGHASEVRLANGKLTARITFGRTTRGEEALTLFADKTLRAFSVGFVPGRIANETTPDGQTVRRLFNCELFEVSAVSIPSNPDAVALRRYKALGIIPESFEQPSDAGEWIAETARVATLTPERSKVRKMLDRLIRGAA